MKKKFDLSASTQESELVLNGEYTDEELTNVQRMFLNNMQRISQKKISTNFITTDEFDGKMKKWRETTSTSPSGRHLGHYKVLVSTIDRSLQENVVKNLQSIQKDIKMCYIGLINYCVKHRYSLNRWKTIVNMMIYKEPGNVKIHRLRVIHLYEADQSLLWGIKWGERMRAAINNKTLHPGQYGGLPGRSCTSLTFFEELRFDYASLTRFPFANFDNDACSCYDRILCALASLAGKNTGFTKTSSLFTLLPWKKPSSN